MNVTIAVLAHQEKANSTHIITLINMLNIPKKVQGVVKITFLHFGPSVFPCNYSCQRSPTCHFLGL